MAIRLGFDVRAYLPILYELIITTGVVGVGTEAAIENTLTKDKDKTLIVDFGQYHGKSTKNIKYKIKHFYRIQHALYEGDWPSEYQLIYGFRALQTCLDQSLIKKVAPNAKLPKVWLH